MEDIDAIIIDSLKNLNCDIEDDIKSLKQFDVDMVVSAISSCLQAISPGTAFPKKLPPTMTQKLKLATTIVEHIRDIGFRGDIGYQTILYFNEVEVRRVLMFLIERLPRDIHKPVEVEETGYIPRLMKEIEQSVKRSLEQFWLPTSVMNRGARSVGDKYIINSLGDSLPLHTHRLKCFNIPATTKLDEEVQKSYWIHVVPDFAKQCASKQLLPSLLFGQTEFNSGYFRSILKEPTMSKPEISIALNDPVGVNTETVPVEKIQVKNEPDVSPVKINTQEKSASPLEEEISICAALEQEIKQYENELAKLEAAKEEEESKVKEMMTQVQIKERALAVANNEENRLKLKAYIEGSADRLKELESQWIKIKTPLVEEYQRLQSSLSSQELEQQENQNKLQTMKQLYNDLSTELREKELLEENLIKKCQQINKINSRSAYTRRILEIVGNIKKQDSEMQKILHDTKEVQKEINNLTGQVDRSFTYCDELIFRDAKYDETARKAYKLLVELRDQFNDIIKAVEEIGVIERERRNIQDQIEVENAKEIPKKLERVKIDLEEIKKESANLMAQQKQ